MPSHQIDDEQQHGGDQQQMDQCTRYVKTEAKQPENEQDRNNVHNIANTSAMLTAEGAIRAMLPLLP